MYDKEEDCDDNVNEEEDNDVGNDNVKEEGEGSASVESTGK